MSLQNWGHRPQLPTTSATWQFCIITVIKEKRLTTLSIFSIKDYLSDVQLKKRQEIEK